ncbi:sensor histidine kinase [Algicola sagamiensis]|uniref:sensor histidine kinase n=1 Tax=Algicola sagamiensis TaxID=163869 RepID=UPI000360E7C1|nr:ATP-binding protein [Algicola sagamiensis]
MADNNREALLIQALEKEKELRKITDKLLEEKKHEFAQYEIKLENLQSDLVVKEIQLEFLTAVATIAFNEETISAMIDIFLSKSTDFLNNSISLFCDISKDDLQLQKASIRGTNEALKRIVQSSPSILNRIQFESIISDLADNNNESQLLEAETYYPSWKEDGFPGFFSAFPLSLSKKSYDICLFFLDESEVDIYRLQTLESSRIILSLTLQDKVQELQLKKRFSELEKAYQKLEQAQSQLFQSEKMASVGQLAAGVAHEINNPVGFVLSNIESLNEYLIALKKPLLMMENIKEAKPEKLQELSDYCEDEDLSFILEDLDELLDSSKNGLVRVKEIVSGLKTFSHSSTDTLDSINVNECIQASLKLVWNELKYKCSVNEDYRSTKYISGNMGQLQQVFVNLLVNASQAIDDEERGTITITTWDDGKKSHVSISDTGCGIDEESISKLFTPFFTTKPVGVGTGLGLSISYSILESHNATIDVESEIGSGTTFTISFPVQSSEHDAVA